MAGQGSARVSLREIDLSASKPVKRVLTGTPAGVVGRAKRGPAFVPTFFADMIEFEEKFGSLSDKGINSNANLYGPLAVNEWMSGNPGSGAFVRVLGVGSGSSNESGAGFTVGEKLLSNAGSPVDNTFVTGSTILTQGGRTYFLGHIVKDKTGSEYLDDCNISSKASGSIIVSNSDGYDTSKTLTIGTKSFTFLDAATTKDNIQINATEATFAENIKTAINLATANGDFDITATIDSIDNTKVNLIVNNAGIAGNVNIQTTATTGSGGLTLAGLAGGTDSVKIIRGILMTPEGVIPQIKLDDSTFGTTGSINSGESFVLKLTNFTTSTVNPHIISCSFNPDASNYFGKIMNTNPYMIKEKGHYLYSSWDMSSNIIETADITNNNLSGFCAPTSQNRNTGTSIIPNFEKFTKRYKTAHSPWVVSQAFGIDEAGASNSGLGDKVVKLFRLHALDDGEIANSQFKITVSNLAKGDLGNWGTFDLAVEKLSSNPVKGGNILIQWKRLTLDVDSPNYIARVIGDKNIRYNFDTDSVKQGLVEEGTYEVSNPFVRVEMSEDVEAKNISSEALPAGFGGLYELNTSNSTIFTATQIQGARVLPIPMLRSIGKGSSTSGREVGAILPWGIKFANKVKLDSAHEEYSEQVFNSSIVNYSKYFVTVDGSNAPAWKQQVDASGNLDLSNDLNFFHLEKIKITKKSATDEADPKKWGDAIFMRTDAATDDVTAGTRRFLRLKKDLNILNTKYMSFSFIMQGGFDGLNIFDEVQHKLANTACIKEVLSTSKTGPSVVAYQKGIDAFSDKSVSNIQLLAVPGIREKVVSDYAIKQAEERFDTMYLMDIGEYDKDGAIIVDENTKPSIENTITEFEARQLDTSFAAAYFPDIVLNKSNGGSLKVPPTVGMLGVISRMDRDQRPWYAPAGITSGLVNANGVAFAINRDQLNELYDADINPVYIPSGRSNVHVFGQKTLLKEPSALDRINVRRLLIYVRREVKNIANRFLFEPNREQTLRNFAAAVEPILQRVQNEGGVERYKVQIDSSTTTQNDVENNVIRGKIYLQPTKSIEFISLDFEVRNSID